MSKVYSSVPIIVNGAWTSWSAWASCSTTCGTGQQQKTRSCTNPSPAYGGSGCPGVTSDTQSCMIKNCPSMYILTLFNRHYLFFLISDHIKEFYFVSKSQHLVYIVSAGKKFALLPNFAPCSNRQRFLV